MAATQVICRDRKRAKRNAGFDAGVWADHSTPLANKQIAEAKALSSTKTIERNHQGGLLADHSAPRILMRLPWAVLRR